VERKEILGKCDHTLLRPDAVWEEVRQLCEDGLAYGVASVCISPCFVSRASAYLGGRLPITTVIGFPNGNSGTAVKCFEAAEAIGEGADELDMVANIGWIKDGMYREAGKEIEEVRRISAKHTLKIIIETCLLTDEEKIEMCRVVSDSGADFIKTSTGFSFGGATLEDVRLLREHSEPHLRIKAAGGISSFADAEAFLRLGADRLGTSRLVKLAKAGAAEKQ
jgi:deoxyribose-phosphate aldolase